MTTNMERITNKMKFRYGNGSRLENFYYVEESLGIVYGILNEGNI